MFSVTLLLLLAAGSYVRCETPTQPALMIVQPGQRLTITCQVSYSVSSWYTAWIRQPAGKGLEWIGMKYTGGSYYKDSLKNKFSIDLGTSSNTVTLNGQNMQPEDTAVYYCARRGSSYGAFDYWGKGTTVTVTSATSKAPEVFPLMSCGSGSGDTVTLGCLATGFTPSSLTFEWKQDETPLPDFIQYPAIQKGSEYMGISQIQVKRQDWDARKSFRCIAKHAAGERPATVIKPNVVYELPTLKVCSSAVDGKEEASFSCFAKDFSPNTFEFKWLKDDKEFNNSVDEISSLASERKDTNGTKLYSAASLLTVRTSELSVSTKFTCVFKGKGKNNAEPEKREDVFFKECTSGGEGCPTSDVDIAIIQPTNQDIFLKKAGILTCRVTVHSGGFEKVVWEDESGKELVSSNKAVKPGIYEAVLDITYDEWSKGLKRNCFVHHKHWFEPLKRPYERNYGGSDEKRPSVFMLPPVEHTSKDEVVLTCFVKDFFPREVFVSWFVDDVEADSTHPFNTTDPVEKDGYYSVYSHLILTTAQWEKPDAVFSCAVYHKSVANSAKSIVRSIGYRTFKNTNMVNLNMNVPETCKA